MHCGWGCRKWGRVGGNLPPDGRLQHNFAKHHHTQITQIKQIKTKVVQKDHNCNTASSSIVIMYWTKCTQKCQRSPVQTECNYVKRLGHFWITIAIGGKIISWSNFSEPPNSNCVCSKHRKATAEICVWTVNCATGKESLRSVPFRLQSPALIEVNRKMKLYVCQSFADFHPFPRCDCKG